MRASLCLLLVAGFLGLACPSPAADSPTEEDYYPLVRCEIPEGVVLEACGFQLMPDGQMAVCGRRGEIWMISDPFSPEVRASQFHLFAEGLHECLSLAERDGWLYAVQRGELTRLKDTDGDGRADIIETVNDDWDISGDYHEYAFGSKFDRDGNLWVTLCLTQSFHSSVPWRGWGLRITPEGKMIPTVSGIRSPGGMGMDLEGEMFMTDNQGPWNGTSSLKHLKPGGFAGHPGSFRWYERAREEMGETPKTPKSGSRFVIEADRIPEYEPPCVLFPYKKMGQSASGIACDTSSGKFGPFAGQMFVGDQMFSTVMRVFLEKVEGRYQGACFPFREGFGSGTVGVEMTPRGSMFVGGTSRGWGSRGTKEFAVERVDWSGRVPFEIHEMRAKPDGFLLTFTEPVDPATAGDPKSYALETYAYLYQEAYGSPEVDATTPPITKITVSDDGKSVHLQVDGLQRGHVHELHLPGVKSARGLPVLHPVAYYTLNEIPSGENAK